VSLVKGLGGPQALMRWKIMENNGNISQLQKKSIALNNSQPSMKRLTIANNNISFVNHGRFLALCFV
jgi:hypothetical protein